MATSKYEEQKFSKPSFQPSSSYREGGLKLVRLARSAHTSSKGTTPRERESSTEPEALCVETRHGVKKKTAALHSLPIEVALQHNAKAHSV